PPVMDPEIEYLKNARVIWSGVPVPCELTVNWSPSAKVKTQSLGFRVCGSVQKSTVCSTIIVQKPSVGTLPTPSIGSSNTPGVAVGMSLKVVPKGPLIGTVRGGAIAAVVKARATQPSAKPRFLNKLSYVII